MSNLKSLAWWRAAGIRALRTALVIAAPYAPTVIYDGAWLIALSASGFGALTSLLTSLRGIPESEGKTVQWYWAVFERSVKTAAQALITAFGTATLFEQVTWAEVPAIVGSSVLGTLIIAVLGQLPEAEEPLARATIQTVVVNNPATGDVTEAALPVVAVAGASTEPEFLPEDIMDAAPQAEPDYIPSVPDDAALPSAPDAEPQAPSEEPKAQTWTTPIQ